MELKELIIKVQEERLQRGDLERYRDEMVGIKSRLHIEIADLKKLRAVYCLEHKAIS